MYLDIVVVVVVWISRMVMLKWKWMELQKD